MYDYNRPVINWPMSLGDAMAARDALVIAEAVVEGDYAMLAAFRALHDCGGTESFAKLQDRIEILSLPARKEAYADIRAMIAEAQRDQE